MITTMNLPESYTPYNTIILCSNTLTGVRYIVAIGDILPLIVGKGDKPRIWLQALVDQRAKVFTTIVEESISKHPSVRVFEQDDVLKIIVSNTLVLSIKATGDSVEIDNLDMRPLGLNIYGTKSELKVGGNTFSGSSISGVGTFIGFEV